MHAGRICLVLYGTKNILRAIVLLFCSNFFQSLKCDGSFTSIDKRLNF